MGTFDYLKLVLGLEKTVQIHKKTVICPEIRLL